MQSFVAANDEKILYAGLCQGLKLPYECATGTCGTCKAKLVSGEIRNLWPLAPGAKKLKKDRGEFLMCQSTAASDCEISLRGQLAMSDGTYNPMRRTATIVETALMTGDVMRFVMELNEPMDFRGGQFCVLNAPGLDGGRAYSMVNYERATSRIEFVIKRLNGGGFSDWMFEHSRDGTSVELFGPLGTATLKPDENKNILCIAGGSGIAGMLSLLEQASSENYFSRNRGWLFFGVRRPEDLFYQSRLAELIDRSNGNLDVMLVFSEGDSLPSSGQLHSKISCAKGFVTPVAMHCMAGQFENTVAFTAGPPPMVDDALRQLILEADIPAEDVRYDKFA